MNENTHIKNLIDKFLTASTSEAEESELADFFASCDNVPPQWQDLAIMFGGFRAEKANVSLPKNNRKNPVVRLAWMAAASVALWLGISFFMGSSETDETVGYPISEREFVVEESEVLPNSQILSDIIEPIESTEKSEINTVLSDSKSTKKRRHSIVSVKEEKKLNASYSTEQIFRIGVAAIEDDELRKEVERLTLEYELKAIEEEADRFLNNQNTIIVSL